MAAVKAASAKDLPDGGVATVQAAGREVAVFKVGGKYHAMDNACPHRGGPLSEGAFEGCVVTCPWHGWQFDVTTGALVMNPNEKLRTYPVRVEGEDVLVDIE